jgi:SAM-dependent methyltransferase
METAHAGHPHQPSGGHAHGHGGDDGHSDGNGHGHGEGHGGGADWAAWAELLDLAAEVFDSYLSGLIAWVRELAGDRPGGRIIDLGSGTGTGTLALARSFGTAEVIALDSSAYLVGRLTATARERGLASRVHARRADLDGDWPGIGAGTVDVAWASLSLHHLADPDAALARVLAALRPGGLVAVAEMPDPFIRFLPDDLGLGRPGLEDRCRAARAGDVAADLPHLGADWGARLDRAGFADVVERPAAIRLTSPLPAAAGRFAQLWLERTRSGLEGRLAADDLAVLDTLIGDGPDSVRHRGDLIVAADRIAWVARRPPA